MPAPVLGQISGGGGWLSPCTSDPAHGARQRALRPGHFPPHAACPDLHPTLPHQLFKSAVKYKDKYEK